jgi:hypothetical protein
MIDCNTVQTVLMRACLCSSIDDRRARPPTSITPLIRIYLSLASLR